LTLMRYTDEQIAHLSSIRSAGMPVHIEARGYVPCIKDGKPNKEPGEEL